MFLFPPLETQNPAQELNNNVVRDFEKNPVKEIDVRAKRARLIQVKFNRKNSHLLASAHGMQVCIWDTRKVRDYCLYCRKKRSCCVDAVPFSRHG